MQMSDSQATAVRPAIVTATIVDICYLSQPVKYTLMLDRAMSIGPETGCVEMHPYLMPTTSVR